MQFHTLLLAAAFAGSACAAPAPLWWPQFRGPGGSGAAAPGEYPVEFGPQTNRLWQTPLPPGSSSPCVWSNHLFVTAFENSQLVTLALDRRDGRILWRHAVEPGVMERGVRPANLASSTPCAHEGRVYVYFGCFGALCLDFEGREQWRRPLPTPVTQHGASSSPVLGQDALFLARDGDVDAHLLALSLRDGRTLWRAERPACRRGFATPLLWREAGATQVVLAGTLGLTAYDALSGRLDWTAGGLPNEMVASPVAGGGLIFAAGWTPGAGAARMSSYDALLAQADANKDGKIAQAEAPSGPARQHFPYIDSNKDGFLTREEWDAMASIFTRSENALIAVRPPKPGAATDGQTLWKQQRGLPYVPAPLYYQDRVYLLKNGGLASCFNAATGAVLYQEERLGVTGDNYASPVAASGRVYAASLSGVLAVFAAGDSLQVLARNKLGEPLLATPAFVEGVIYVRGEKQLMAFGRPDRLPR